MIRILVKKQMTEIFRGYFYNAKKNKAYSQARTALLIFAFVLLMVGVIGGMFFALSMVLCEPMSAVGMDWMYFALMGFTSVFLGAFGSVFNTFSSLYLSKDNDLLLSMPIPVNAIMVSRLLSVYLMGLMYSSAVILTAVLLALSIVVWLVLSHSFLNIATSSGYTERKVYREKAAKQKSISRASHCCGRVLQ